MKNSLFWLSILLLTIMCSVKVWFFHSETSYQLSLLAQFDLLITIGLTAAGWLFFFRSHTQTQVLKKNEKKSRLFYILLFGVSLLMVGVFFTTVNKKSQDWDDIALYDARGKFIVSGMKLSEMSSLSTYDFKNGYYYLLYPPFTSILHGAWQYAGITFPPNVMYAVMFVMLGLATFSFSRSQMGLSISVLTTLVVLGQQHIFSTALVAYTNLPYTLFLSLACFLFHQYLVTRKLWLFLLGAALLGSSQWIRFLEPSWLAVVLAFGCASWLHLGKKRSVVTTLFLLFVCSMQYKAWSYFVDIVAQNQSIFTVNAQSIIEPIVGAFTGALLNIAAYFVTAWGTPLFIHVSSLFTSPEKENKATVSADLFFKLTLVFSIGMYFAGLYFISFQVNWWGEMGGSLIRSSTFMLPLSIFLLIKSTQQQLQRKKA